MPTEIKDLGNRGESSAASFLCGEGYEIVGRNVRCGHLETDIVAKNDKFLIFVEVKTRRETPSKYNLHGRPADAVDKQKQAKIRAAAIEYYNKNKEEFSGLIPRIDVVEVYVSPTSDKYKVLKIFHMENPMG